MWSRALDLHDWRRRLNLPNFLHLSSDQTARLIHEARERVLYCAPGLQQPLAAALVNAQRQLGANRVRVVLDVNDATARMGYGDFDAVALLRESGVDVYVEPGLRACVLICDGSGYAFFTPPMLVELQDDQHVGVNALALQSEQSSALLANFFPQPNAEGTPRPEPELGKHLLSRTQMHQVKESLDANPPQRFDLARKVNVFNAFIEFVEVRLTGLHIARHTVQLPKSLVLAIRDDETAKRLLTTFKVVSDQSKVAREASEIDRRTQKLREIYTRSLGDGLGTVILRSKRHEFTTEADAIRAAIKQFREKVVERLEKELSSSRNKLVEGLLPAVKKARLDDLRGQVSGKISADIVRRYVDDELSKVFPSATELVGEMKLETVFKGVTYETLNMPSFQKRVREAFPYENWDKPFREFEAAPSEQAFLSFE